MAESKGDLRILLLGKTGSGKSSTGNTIAGKKKLFSASASFGSFTKKCQREVVHRYGYRLEIVDFPGLFDTDNEEEEIALSIAQAVSVMHPGPNAILYVIPVGRYTHEEFRTYQRLINLFDPDITRHMVILFTRGDDLEANEESVHDMIVRASGELKQVLSECGNRFVVFNNRAPDNQGQIHELLSTIIKMIDENKGQSYSCPKFCKIGKAMEEEVRRRLQKEEENEVRQTRYGQKLEQDKRRHEMENLKQKAADDPNSLLSIIGIILADVVGFIVRKVLAIFQ